MIRSSFRFAGRAVAIAGVLALGPEIVVAAPTNASPHTWDTSRRVGLVVEGTDERFGTGDLVDLALAPPGEGGDPTTPDEAVLSARFRDSAARLSLLAELGLDRRGASWLHLRARVRGSRTLTRGDISARAGATTGFGDVSVEDQVLFQAGPDGLGAGLSDLARAACNVNLPLGCELGLSASGERSWAGQDSLRDVFNYRTFRPAVELSRSTGPGGAVALRGGTGRKWTGPSAPGAWRERWGEVEWSALHPSGADWTLRLHTESRRYQAADSLLPSSDESWLEGDARLPLGERTRLHVVPSLHRVAYSRDDSLLFHDHWVAECELRGERSLFSRGSDPSGLLDPTWTASLGAKGSLLRNRRIESADYRSWSVLAGFARTPGDAAWGDLTVEAGRRDYRGGTSAAVAYQGFNLSLRGTDYTFVSGSLLGDADLSSRLRLEFFVLADVELHSDRNDDFSLWTGTLSLSWSF